MKDRGLPVRDGSAVEPGGARGILVRDRALQCETVDDFFQYRSNGTLAMIPPPLVLKFFHVSRLLHLRGPLSLWYLLPCVLSLVPSIN